MPKDFNPFDPLGLFEKKEGPYHGVALSPIGEIDNDDFERMPDINLISSWAIFLTQQGKRVSEFLITGPEGYTRLWRPTWESPVGLWQ